MQIQLTLYPNAPLKITSIVRILKIPWTQKKLHHWYGYTILTILLAYK